MTQFKNKFSKFLFASLIILFISSCVTNNNDDGDNTLPLEDIALLNVAYGTNPQQKYDIYLPANRSNISTKVVVLVHGGSWIGGDKRDMNYLVNALKVRHPNHAVVNINYRLASVGNSPFPMQIDDIKSVLSNLEANEENYQINDDYGFVGVSAGAQLSMLYTYKFDLDAKVAFVGSIVGPTNFTDPSYLNDPNYADLILGIQLLTGVNYEDDPQYYIDLSPYHVATVTSPPTILFYGDEDELIPTSQGVEMQAKLDELGVTNEFTLYAGEGHGWDGENAVDTLNKLSDFIDTYF